MCSNQIPCTFDAEHPGTPYRLTDTSDERRDIRGSDASLSSPPPLVLAKHLVHTGAPSHTQHLHYHALLRAGAFHRMQQTHGNRAVQRAIHGTRNDQGCSGVAGPPPRPLQRSFLGSAVDEIKQAGQTANDVVATAQAGEQGTATTAQDTLGAMDEARHTDLGMSREEVRAAWPLVEGGSRGIADGAIEAIRTVAACEA